MVSIQESVFCRGRQLVANGKAHIGEAGFQSIQTQCCGNKKIEKERNGENRKSSCP